MRVTQERFFQTSRGELLFRFTQIPAKRASRFLMRFGKIVGPAMGTIAESGDFEEMKGLGSAVEKLFQELNEDQFDWLSSELMSSVLVMVDGVPTEVNVDLLFTGKLSEWFKVLVHSFEVSFGDFSGALADMFRRAESARAKKTPSPTGSETSGTSTGGSTG